MNVSFLNLEPLQFPTTPLQAPPDLIDKLSASITLGKADAANFRKEHGTGELWLLGGHSLISMKWPPAGDEQLKELAYMHALVKGRTAEQTATAQWYGKHGLTEAWDVYLADYSKQVGPEQARVAAKLLHDTLNITNEITQTAKAASGRKRPYDIDPTLTTVIDKPGGSPSYPSGHTTAAFAAAIVLGHLMPARAKEFLDIATQASYARIYGGVHYPSDVLNGARMGAEIAFHMTSISAAVPVGSAAPTPRRKKRRKLAA